MALLSVRELASLLGVAEQTIHNHLQDGRLSPAATGPLRFEHDDVRHVKLLKETDISEGSIHALPRERVVAARLAGVVTPSEDGRHSLADIVSIKEWVQKPAVSTAAVPVTAAPTVGGRGLQAPALTISGPRAEMVKRYLVSGKSPNDLPDDFWLTPRPPPFIPPRDVYREVVQGASSGVEDPEGTCWNFKWVRVYRSGYYKLVGGEPAWQAAEAYFKRFEFDDLPEYPAVGKPPPWSQLGTVQWEEARNEWLFAWERRHRMREAYRGDAGGHLLLTTGSPNRIEILHDYHLFFEWPRQLPPEFWEGDEMPAFDAPTNVGHYRLGKKAFRDASPPGMLQERPRPVTEIIQARGWFCFEREPDGPSCWDEKWFGDVDGHFDPRASHPEVDSQNAAYEGALREWRTSWELYRELRRRYG